MSTERKMTVKGFLHKSTQKAAASAKGFIDAHRAWLETGDLAEVTSPILRMLDEGQVFPTPALDLIKEAVLTHHLRSETKKAEARMAEGQEGSVGETKTSKPWIARVFDKDGNLVITANTKGDMVELEQAFLLSSDADRWCDRRLFEGAPDWFAVVQHTSITRAVDGEPLTTVIMRQDAIARILKKPASAAVKKTGSRDGKLSFGVKVSQSRAVFSHG